MKKLFPTLCVTAALSVLAACSGQTELNRENLQVGMQAYLAQRGDLCLAKNTWPIDVTQKEIDLGARNALQMPVLERLGLVKSSVAKVIATEEDRSAEILVHRYELSARGREFYLSKPMRSMKSDGSSKTANGDLCAAKLTLDRVVDWQAVSSSGSEKMVVVNYTYHVSAADWVKDAEIQKVFPMLARVINGAGSMQLQESFKLTPTAWVAVDL